MSRWLKRASLTASFILIVLLSLGTALAGAAEDTAVEEAICSDDLLLAGPNAFAGKPVSLFNGAETFTRTDLTIGNHYPIVIQRRYNSKSSYASQLGYGWALNYDRRVYTYPDGSVTLRKECGWKRRFIFSGGMYITPMGEAGTLVKNADESFTFTQKDGSQEIYDPQGRLATLIDAKGNSIVISYEDGRLPLWGLLLTNLSTSPLVVTRDYRIARIDEKDSAGNLTGKWVTFQYDLQAGWLNSITDSLGRTVTYGHDSYGNFKGASISGLGTVATYDYDDPANVHYLTGINEGQGQYTNHYDIKGRIYQQLHGAGIIDIEYLDPMKKTRVTTTVKDIAGAQVLNKQVRTVEFDANGQIAKETDTFGTVKIFNRDSSMHLQREEYWENTGTIDTPNLVLRAATDYTYDIYGNMKTKTEASNHGSTDWDAIKKTTTYTYYYEINAAAPPVTYHKLYQEKVKSVVNPATDRVITYNHDDTNGNLQTVVETGLLGDGTSYSYTTTYGYYGSADGILNGKLKSVDGPRTDVQDITTYYYDPITGNLSSVDQPLAGSTVYTGYDSLGNPETVTDPNGNISSYQYDAFGRIRNVTASGDTASMEYVYVSNGCSSCGTAGGNKIDHVVLPEGNRITYHYDDGMGNLTSITDNDGNSINYVYDTEGNRLREEIRDSSGLLQKYLDYQYDALNRVKQVRNPDNSFTEYGYDYAGRRASLTDPNTRTTTYLYDALGRLTDTIQPGTITTKYGYNSSNNMTSVLAANNITTTYKYDDKGRVYQVISPDTGATTYGYDPAGNMVSKKDAKNVTIIYAYDALNRLSTIDFPTDTDIVFGHDTCVNGRGRLCSMTDASGTTTYEYTPKGQIKKETKVIDGNTSVTQYSYDMNGNLKTMTYPSGNVITYTYSNDKVIYVQNGAQYLAGRTDNYITYKPFGGVTSILYGNNVPGSVSYDNQYRVTAITAGTVMSLSYPTYDNNGNIKAITDVLDSTKNKSFTYDALDRLDTANSTGIWGSLGWTYDGAGNRMTEGSNSYTYFPNTNKLSNANGKSYGYDNNGNTTGEGSRTFVYNDNQRLITVIDGSTTKGEYTYNGIGQRVKKVANGATTIFHYDQAGHIIAESDIAGNISVEYVYLNDQPLAKIQGTNIYYYHNDHLGTPLKMTDPSGTVVWAADYKPFGEVINVTGSITNNLRFPGQYYDAETDLYYNLYRDYNPIIGRYIEADPIGEQEGENHLFVYVSNNPIKEIDPEGLWGCTPDMEARCEPGCAAKGLTYKPGNCDAFPLGCGNWSVVCNCEPKSDEKWMCEGYAQYQVKGPGKQVVRGHWVVAYGKTEPEAAKAWKKIAQNSSPQGYHARHIKPKCRKIR